MSCEISDLCETSDLLFSVSYFASQSKKIKFSDYFFDVCCVNKNFLVKCQMHTTGYNTGISETSEKYLTRSYTSIIFLFPTVA